MPCNQSCNCSYNNYAWVFILAFIVIWYFGGYHGNFCGCGNCGGCGVGPCGPCGGCGC